MDAVLSLVFPVVSAAVAITFTVIAHQGPVLRPARWAAIAFSALALCTLIDAHRAQLSAWIVVFVVPLQLITIAALCEAALKRVGAAMPRMLLVPLLLGGSALHVWLFFVHPDSLVRGWAPAALSALVLAVTGVRLRAAAKTLIDAMMVGIVALSAVTFAARTVLIASGEPISPLSASSTASPQMLLIAVAHVLATMLWLLGLLLAIGKDLIDLHHRVTLVDPLTGVGNRRALDAAIEADGIRAPIYGAAMVIDLDHFKAINDTHGHEAGDIVLESVGALLATQLGAIAHVARVGGEEFAVLVPLAHAELARALAEVVLANFANVRLPVAGKVTASIGLAHRKNGEDLRSVLRRADAELYRAKNDGRDRVAADMDQVPVRRLRLVTQR